jgi:hypothetical protein
MDETLDCSDGLDVFDFKIAIAIAGHEVMLEVDLHDETLLSAELLTQRFARSGELFRRFVETIGRSQIPADGE